jgi:hypothetical protein
LPAGNTEYPISGYPDIEIKMENAAMRYTVHIYSCCTLHSAPSTQSCGLWWSGD